jgi:predicted helicase
VNNSKKGSDYEIKIYNHLAKKYPDLEMFHNRMLKGSRSGIERQIDILIRKGNTDFNDDTVIECKYYKNNIDVKVVDSFIGMLQDVGIAHGILIVKKGASTGAINRAGYEGIKIDIVSFTEDDDLFNSLDECLDFNIRNLMFTEMEFYKRIKQNSGYVNVEKSSYQRKTIYFNKGYANTDYYARKKLISSSLRHFRDFPDNDNIKIGSVFLTLSG